jgi:hypothetical protein
MRKQRREAETLKYVDWWEFCRLFNFNEDSFLSRYNQTPNGGVMSAKLVTRKSGVKFWVFVVKDVQIFDSVGLLRLSAMEIKEGEEVPSNYAPPKKTKTIKSKFCRYDD